MEKKYLKVEKIDYPNHKEVFYTLKSKDIITSISVVDTKHIKLLYVKKSNDVIEGVMVKNSNAFISKIGEIHISYQDNKEFFQL